MCRLNIKEVIIMTGGKDKGISDAEFEIISVLWSADEPMTAQDISEREEMKKWKYSTIATLLKRMYEKGAVTYEKRGRYFYYSPLIDEHEYKTEQTKSLVSRLYNGSVKNLVAALFENKQLSDDDVKDIKDMFDLWED